MMQQTLCASRGTSRSQTLNNSCDACGGFEKLPQSEIELKDKTAVESVEPEGKHEDGFEVHGVPLLQTIFNVLKNLVGEGLLTLPHCLALGTGLAPALLIFVSISCLMAYSFSVVGRMCVNCPNERTNEGICVWVRGKSFAKFVVAVITFKGFMSCIVLPMVLKTTVSTLLNSVDIPLGKQGSLVAVTCAVFIPLCSLKDLRFLGYTSIIGVMGEIYAVLFVVLRYLDGSYQEGGHFFKSQKRAFRPKLRMLENLWDFGPSTFVLISSIAFCYMAHYNAPKFCKVMEEPTRARWNIVTAAGYGSAALMYTVVMVSGYLTFGEHSQSFVLDNYAEDDHLALGAHFGISIAVILCYPLIFTALRDGLFQLLELPRTATSFHVVTYCLLFPTIAVALVMDDIGIMNALAGAMFATFITLVFPGLFVIFGGVEKIGNANEVKIAYVLVVLGLVMSIAGTTKVVLTAIS